MIERRGTLGLIRRYRNASLAIAGFALIAASLLNSASIVAMIRGSVRMPPQLWFFSAIPLDVYGIGCLIAFPVGVFLLLFAAAGWALDG